METATALRRRMELAEELRSVTGTMKSLAAVTIHQYERSMHALHEYVRTVELGLQILLLRQPELLPFPPSPDGQRTLLVVFGSARGLCGPINRHIARGAREMVDARSPSGDPGGTPDLTVVASGARVAMELEPLGLAPRTVLDVPGSADGIGTHVRDLLLLIDRWRAAGDTGRVVLVHPRPLPGGRQYEPGTVTLLPIDPERIRRLGGAPWPTRRLPAWRGSWTQVLASLTRQLLYVDLHRAHAETQVCIHRARLTAMQGAEESIDERLQELSTRYHRRRQAAITGELLDVISGFEAATSGESDRRPGGG